MKKLAICTALAVLACAANQSALAQQHLQYFGYYANNGSISENQNHTNITFIGVWTSNVDQATSSILGELATAKKYGIKAIVTVSPFLFTNTAPNLGCPYGNLPNSDQTWSTFVNRLISSGYLVPNNPGASTVAAFYPVDEPELCGLGDVNGVVNPALANAIDTIRHNPSTSNFPVATIYSINYPSAAQSIHLFDWVGMDDYSLKNEDYISAFESFENYINRGTQKTILVPQAATGGTDHTLDGTPDDPAQMFEMAKSDSSVIMLMPFLWSHNGWLGTSQIPSLLSQYTDIGKQIKYGLFDHLISDSVPTTMNAGQTSSVTVKFINDGSDTWTTSQGISLGSLYNTWVDSKANRVPLPSNIAPGEVASFTFNIHAPSQPGWYALSFQMVEDGVDSNFFGDTTPLVPVHVVSPPSGWISANPNPCIIPYGESLCTSTISWSTSSSDTQVWVTDADGSSPSLFYGASASGSASASWITAKPHIFYLESNGEKFGSVSVSGRVTTTPPPPRRPPCWSYNEKNISPNTKAAPLTRPSCP